MPDAAAPQLVLRLVENPDDPERPFAFLASVETPAGKGKAPSRQHLLAAARERAEAGDAAGLASLLAPLHAAGERLPWLRELVESKRVYHPLGFDVGMATTFLRSVPEMREAGLEARLPDWWKKRAKAKVDVKIGGTASRVGAEALLDFHAALALGDATLSAEEADRLMDDDATGQTLVLLKGQWAAVDAEQLRQAIARLHALASRNLDGITLLAAMRMLGSADSASGGEDEEEDPTPWVHATAGDAFREVVRPAARSGAAEAAKHPRAARDAAAVPEGGRRLAPLPRRARAGCLPRRRHGARQDAAGARGDPC